MSDLFQGMQALIVEGKSRPTTFDLRFKCSTARFRFSARAVDELYLVESGNGIVVAINEAAKVAMIGVLPKSQASLLTAKTPEFAHAELRARIDEFIGRVPEGEEHQNFRLTEAGVHQGVLYFKIEKWDGTSGLISLKNAIPGANAKTALPIVEASSGNGQEEVSADTVAEVTAPVEVATSAEEEEDPEALFEGLD